MISTRADTIKLENFFGFKPKVTLKEGLAREWEWMKSFVQSEDDEMAIKANVQPIIGVDEDAIAQVKADEKAEKKAARKAKSNAAKKDPAQTELSAAPPESNESNG